MDALFDVVLTIVAVVLFGGFFVLSVLFLVACVVESARSVRPDRSLQEAVGSGEIIAQEAARIEARQNTMIGSGSGS